MRKFKIFFFCCLCIIGYILPTKAQNYIDKYIPEYIDFYITSKIIDSLRNECKIKDFIIYQTNINSKDVIDSALLTNDTIEVSYLIWEKKGILCSYLITDSCVYASKYLEKNKNSLFSYSHFNQLWLQKDEENKVTPQVNEPYKKDIVLFLTPTYRRFFEFGEGVWYELNEMRNIYRIEYLNFLKLSVFQFNQKWRKVFNNEKRWWGNDEIEFLN